MITRREAALRLDIPLEMAHRHGFPARMTEAEFDDLDAHPPLWLQQSRDNRTGKKPVWVQLTCTICGFTEAARPKKWWPAFTWLSCADHPAADLPPVTTGYRRGEIDGIGSRFVGIVDEPVTQVAPVESAQPRSEGQPEPVSEGQPEAAGQPAVAQPVSEKQPVAEAQSAAPAETAGPVTS